MYDKHYSMADIETVEQHCKHPDCSYRKLLHLWTPYCDYIGATGKSRGCKISECDKYTTEPVGYPSIWARRKGVIEDDVP